jgi:hypothetical protein
MSNTKGKHIFRYDSVRKILDTPSYDIRGVSSGSCRNVVVEKVPDVSEDQAYCLHAQGRNSERSKSASR